jgi:MmyB-like transcription regulator ligand binding domain
MAAMTPPSMRRSVPVMKVPSRQSGMLRRLPDVGDLDLGYQSMSLNGTPGQALIAYYAKPGTAEHDALTLLDRADIDQHQLPTEQTETIDAPHPKRSDSNRDSNAAET